MIISIIKGKYLDRSIDSLNSYMDGCECTLTLFEPDSNNERKAFYLINYKHGPISFSDPDIGQIKKPSISDDWIEIYSNKKTSTENYKELIGSNSCVKKETTPYIQEVFGDRVKSFTVEYK